MTATDWTITTKSNGDITAEALTADWPTVTRGSRARLRLWFDNPDSEGSLIVESGESHTVPSGTTETYRRIRLEDTATVTLEDNANLRQEPGGAYTLLQYLDYADAAAYGTGINNQPWFHNQLPASYGDVQSLVLAFEPNGDLKDRSVTGLWGIVTGGSDARNATLTNWQIELDVFVLAERDEYATHSDIESDLGA